jgi:Uma2 family endonuclease
MTAAPQPKLMTAEELFELPDDGRKYELVRGELVEMTPPGGWHGQKTLQIGARLLVHVEPRDLGRVYAEAGFILARDPDIVRAPDVAFVRADRVPSARDELGYVPVAPDLAIEIVSPNDRASDVLDKVLEYLEHGVRLVWVVDRKRRTVTVWTPDRVARLLGEGDALDGGDVIPGFRLPVADIFR